MVAPLCDSGGQPTENKTGGAFLQFQLKQTFSERSGKRSTHFHWNIRYVQIMDGVRIVNNHSIPIRWAKSVTFQFDSAQGTSAREGEKQSEQKLFTRADKNPTYYLPIPIRLMVLDLMRTTI